MAGAGQQLAQQGLRCECLMMCHQQEQVQALALMLGELQVLVHLVSLLYMPADHLHPFGRQPSPARHAQESHFQTHVLLAIALLLSTMAQRPLKRGKEPPCWYAMLTFISLWQVCLQSS